MASHGICFKTKGENTQKKQKQNVKLSKLINTTMLSDARNNTFIL